MLLKTGVAAAEDWKRSTDEPLEFIQNALQRFIAEHGEQQIDGAFDLCVTLSTDPCDLFDEGEPGGDQAFLSVEIGSCGFVNLGPAIEVLEKANPRLPVTFTTLLLGALNRWFRIYDYRDAQERLNYLQDVYSSEEDAEALASLPDRNSILPASLERKPLGASQLDAVLLRLSLASTARNLIEAARALDRIARRTRMPSIPDDVRDSFSEMNPPLPVLLAVFRQGDAIEALFDEESQYMLELVPEPWPFIPMNGSDPTSIRRAFLCLGTALDTLAAARGVLDFVPGWEPIRKEL